MGLRGAKRTLGVSMDNHDQHYYKILSEIDAGRSVTQRLLARELGIALGLTNLLMKRLIERGFVKTKREKGRRTVKYFLTRSGATEKARLSRMYLENTLRLYTETRERIREALYRMEARDGKILQRIIFFGAGDVAEIAFITLNRSRFELVGVVDDQSQGQEFLGYKIGSPDDLVSLQINSGYDRIVVTTFQKVNRIKKRLSRLHIPSAKISFL
ncbi:MAG: winged helix-turn-helix transcriptional regulator [Acidobacteria bacterium]|nr:winged helix-turn-helix transcriptional regulator [Acidobacteriota bacterium]